MTASTILVFQLSLVILGTVCSTPVCPNTCTTAQNAAGYRHMYFQHVSDLNRSSVAPWELRLNVSESRLPENFEYAVCKDCTVEHMVAKPIYIKIFVYERIRSKPSDIWCKCPYEVAVGCTCVTT